MYKLALVVIDMQNDFIHPAGLLNVKLFSEDNKYNITSLMVNCYVAGIPIITSQCWHPRDHESFKIYGKHCEVGTWGAELAEDYPWHLARLHIKKGLEKEVDSYSIYQDNEGQNPTGLKGMFKDLGIEGVIHVGVCSDICVDASAWDSYKFGFNSYVIEDACAPLNPGYEKRKDSVAYYNTNDFMKHYLSKMKG